MRIIGFKHSKHCTIYALLRSPNTHEQIHRLSCSSGIGFSGGTVIASNSTRFYGVEKFPKPETLADSRGILGDFREFDESNGTCPLPAFNDSNLIDSRNMTIRCYISIMGLCITVFWYKCVILWDICFIISLLKS